MASPYTTAEQVRSIAVEIPTTANLVPYIETAALLVTDACGGFGYSDAKMELITRWLAAHFYTVSSQKTASEGAGPVNESFQYKVDLGLSVTVYGQQAMALDTKGGLAKINRDAIDGKRRLKPVLSFLGGA